MTEVLSLLAMTVAVVLLAIFLRNSSLPFFGILLSCVGGILILWQILPYFFDLIEKIYDFSSLAGVKFEFWGLLLKVIIITYLGDFTVQLCLDVGEGGLAQKLELGIKVLVMAMALPLWEEILKTVIEVFG